MFVHVGCLVNVDEEEFQNGSGEFHPEYILFQSRGLQGLFSNNPFLNNVRSNVLQV